MINDSNRTHLDLRVEQVNRVEVQEVVEPRRECHLITVGQESHGHYGVNERCAHALIVPRHNGAAAQCHNGCPQQMCHSSHAIVGKMFHHDDIVTQRRREELSDQGRIQRYLARAYAPIVQHKERGHPEWQAQQLRVGLKGLQRLRGERIWDKGYTGFANAPLGPPRQSALAFPRRRNPCS